MTFTSTTVMADATGPCDDIVRAAIVTHDEGSHGAMSPNDEAAGHVDADIANSDEEDTGEEEAYESSFSKLQKLKAKYCAENGNMRARDGATDTNLVGGSDDSEMKSKPSRRRRGGYGNSSVLETLDVSKGNERDDLEQGIDASIFLEDPLIDRSTKNEFDTDGFDRDDISRNEQCEFSERFSLSYDDDGIPNEATSDVDNSIKEVVEEDMSGFGSDDDEVKPKGRKKASKSFVSDASTKVVEKNHSGEVRKEENRKEEGCDDEMIKLVSNDKEGMLKGKKNGSKAGPLDGANEEMQEEYHEDGDEPFAKSESRIKGSSSGGIFNDDEHQEVPNTKNEENFISDPSSNVVKTNIESITFKEPQSDSTTTTPKQPIEEELIQVVDRLFRECDIDSVTVKDIQRSVKSHFGMEKLTATTKASIKMRLTELVNKANEPVESEVEGSPELESEEEMEGAEDDGNDSSSDYDVRPRSSRKKGSKTKRKSRDHEDDEATHSDDSIEAKRTKRRTSKKKTRSSKSKKGRMAKHIRDHAAKARMRQLEEARIRDEELGHLAADDVEGNEEESEENVSRKSGEIKSGPQLSEQDRQRAMAIASRFDTNREELVAKRAEIRIGLIDKLRQTRLENITLREFAIAVKKEETADELARQTSKAESTKVTVESESSKEDSLKSANQDCNEARKGDIDTSKNSSSTGIIDLEESDEETDDELEIVAPGSDNTQTPTTTAADKENKLIRKSAFDYLMSRSRGQPSPSRQTKKSTKKVIDPRAALRISLIAKQKQAGNRWLARELGYKTEEDHIRDCKEAEERKRKQILLMEQQAALSESTKSILANSTEEMQFDDDVEENEDEEDEELAYARQLEETEMEEKEDQKVEDVTENDINPESADVHKPNNEINDTKDLPTLEDSEIHGESHGSVRLDDTSTPAKSVKSNAHEILSSPTTESATTSEGKVVTPPDDATSGMSSNLPDVTGPTAAELPRAAGEESKPDYTSKDSFEAGNIDNTNPKDPATNDTESFETSSEPKEEPTTKKPKNSAWQAMLQKEKEALAREKKRRRKGGGLVEGEAEEEEEEEGIVGLEDFGFSIEKKKDEEDDEDVDVDEDDLEHVVDDVSDNEGDEEAGEAARKKFEAREEKERHKEIIRRMREGYDGRRGGIASGVGGARGTLRFDQLVAADNRDDAKRLGLLNDDELNSDDEDEEGGEGKKDKKDAADDEDDEAALLDKMLKERFLHRQDDEFLEENFSDDDEEEEVDDKNDNVDGEDDEEKEQDRLAKRFAKRARMNRILEAYEGDDEFTRSRLIDEDETTQHDLKIIKNTLTRKRSISGLGITNQDSKENSRNAANSNPSKKLKSHPLTENKSAASNAGTTGNPSKGGSLLSVALMSSFSINRTRKTSFLNRGAGGKPNAVSRSYSSCSSKSVSLSHVVFVGGESQSAVSSSNLGSNSNSMKGAKRSIGKSGQFMSSSKVGSKRPASSSTSLWSKVCSKNFRSR